MKQQRQEQVAKHITNTPSTLTLPGSTPHPWSIGSIATLFAVPQPAPNMQRHFPSRLPHIHCTLQPALFSSPLTPARNNPPSS